jgi:SAM-dependent methyltransferase
VTALARPLLRDVNAPTSALQLYDEALRATATGREHTLQLCDDQGRCQPMPLHAWHAPGLPGDQALLDRCRGATLDVGCGPGRLTAALTARSLPALGIDISAAAVELTRRRGGPALRVSVFGPLPAEGRWNTVLLADGNIGIGGDPGALLRRSRALLTAGGRVVLELDAIATTESQRIQLWADARRSEFFDWARVGPGAIADLAATSGLTCQDIADEEGRWFSVLTRA